MDMLDNAAEWVVMPDGTGALAGGSFDDKPARCPARIAGVLQARMAGAGRAHAQVQVVAVRLPLRRHKNNAQKLTVNPYLLISTREERNDYGWNTEV
jgi:hypothetical protein